MIREAVLKELKRREWSLLHLSEQSGVPYRGIHDWLAPKGQGTRGPRVSNIEKIMGVLGLKVANVRDRGKKPR